MEIKVNFNGKEYKTEDFTSSLEGSVFKADVDRIIQAIHAVVTPEEQYELAINIEDYHGDTQKINLLGPEEVIQRINDALTE